MSGVVLSETISDEFESMLMSVPGVEERCAQILLPSYCLGVPSNSHLVLVTL